ncbi:hypothetical protein EJB05_26971 [Eragrostis curvula]|uniref:Uncharacterized protein n=1 Tax=Eragrostis curvula TaxID=38414 RepID=A0A5J9UL67_9POAL|nr:hypothetical protein EJB05_26971 [Eragrostis curvula]
MFQVSAYNAYKYVQSPFSQFCCLGCVVSFSLQRTTHKECMNSSDRLLRIKSQEFMELEIPVVTMVGIRHSDFA